ncbi:MAG TPA: DUF5985 family protein [Steroidobacteraceae bacterium]|jgi:hypothetical protein
MAEFVYALCAATSTVCVIMLFRGYRTSRTRLLFWACLCFAGLAINNLLLFVDLIILPEIDLSIWRLAIAVAAMSALLFGLIWEAK